MQNPIALPVTGTVGGLTNNIKANEALETIATCFLGPDEPNPTYPSQWWADTTAGILRRRNTGNTAWFSFLNLATGALLLPVGAGISFEGATDDAYETTLVAADPTADRTITLPNESMTVAGRDVAQTFSAVQSPATASPTIIATGTFSFDPSIHGQVCTLTATNAITITLAAAAGKIVAGTHYTLRIVAGDTSARTLAKGASVAAPGGALPITSLSTTSGARDVFHLVGVDANSFEVLSGAADVRTS